MCARAGWLMVCAARAAPAWAATLCRCLPPACRYLADMIIALLRRTLVGLALTPYSQEDEDRARAPLGIPLYPVRGQPPRQ